VFKKMIIGLTGFVAVATVSYEINANCTYYARSKASETFEDEWQKELSSSFEVCFNFSDRMADYSDTCRKDKTALKNERLRFVDNSGVEDNDKGLDTVDIIMVCTHGGAWDDVFTIVMWDNNTRVFSDEMRLGDDGRGLSIYTSYTCNIMKPDEDIWNRWEKIFKGGLKYASAFWEASKHGSAAKGLGEKYANLLHGSGATLKYSWLDAMDDYTGNTPAVMASGVSVEHCEMRRDTMLWSNFKNSFNRFRDSEVKNVCWTRRRAN
jgi:hypothetical protein